MQVVFIIGLKYKSETASRTCTRSIANDLLEGQLLTLKYQRD